MKNTTKIHIIIFLFFTFSLPSWGLERNETLEDIIQCNSFTTNRHLSNYKNLLGLNFVSRLTELNHMSEHGAHVEWLDAGAGLAFAQRDFYSEIRDKNTYRLTAVSWIKPDSLELDAFLSAEPDFIYRHGQQLEDMAFTPLQFDIITDIYGAFSYSLRINELFAQYHRILKMGGKLWIYTATVRTIFYDGQNSLTLKQLIEKYAHGFQVTSISKNNMASIEIEKNAETFYLPQFTLVTAAPGRPPYRVFILDQPRAKL